MLIAKPMSIRRSEFIKIKQDEAENAPSFLRRVMAKARAADIEKMTPQEHCFRLAVLDHGITTARQSVGKNSRVRWIHYF